MTNIRIGNGSLQHKQTQANTLPEKLACPLSPILSFASKRLIS